MIWHVEESLIVGLLHRARTYNMQIDVALNISLVQGFQVLDPK